MTQVASRKSHSIRVLNDNFSRHFKREIAKRDALHAAQV
jgi:hypothetical protein